MDENDKSPWDDLEIQQDSAGEQAETVMIQLARQISVFFRELLREKFTRAEALSMSIKYIESLLNAAKK